MQCYKIFCAAILLSSAGLQAQEQAQPIHPQLSATHTFLLGSLRQNADTEFFANVDRQEIPKARLSLGDLGLRDTDYSWVAEYRYRINDKWLLSLGGYTFSSTGSVEARNTFEYDGVVFEAGAKVDSKLKVDTYIADVMYKVYGSEKAQLYLGGGVHVSDLSADLKVKVFVEDKERIGASSGNSLLAPLPNLRMQGMYAFSSRWAVSATTGWLSLNYQDYEGSFAYISGRLSYRVTDRFGLGLGYQYLNMDFSARRKHGDVGVDIKFNGPSAYLLYSF